ncbi:MAG TPA: RNA polymerase factor sigma-54 [Steroidobacteraceae bacterium]|jgi:RNA polymerase sigma-54 factor|nr:RNA polymerase factor sigma-54 [Steroidobacteraceae bacterium]
MLKPSLQLKLGQQLTMTPQLQQAIRLLQLPTIELQAHIRELLESNVMLEQDEDVENGTYENLPSTETAPEIAAPTEESSVEVVDDSWADQPVGAAENPWSSGDGGDEDRQQEFANASGPSLRDHLLWQLELAHLAARELAIGRAIIDAINDDGYLSELLDVIGASLKPEIDPSVEEVEQVLGIVQLCDPAGVAARSLSECLLLQLEQLESDTPGLSLAKAIARSHLALLAERELTALRRELKTSDGELETAVALVRSCNPRPGSAVSGASAEYVVPDVFVRRTPRGWSVEINAATLPRVRLNQSYASLVGRSASHASMRTQLQEARWLLKSLEIRNDTLTKVARSIVERQTEFLERGEEYMRPMILRDIADAISMHESTVSRVTSGKYMHTPRGVFELRYFFSSQVEGSDGSGTSSTAIRAKIRKLIREEDSAAPLSDSRIAEILSGEGIMVARRTVAKYRETMGLAPSNERRRANGK